MNLSRNRRTGKKRAVGFLGLGVGGFAWGVTWGMVFFGWCDRQGMSWWCPLRGPLGSFIPTFPAEHQVFSWLGVRGVTWRWGGDCHIIPLKGT